MFRRRPPRPNPYWVPYRQFNPLINPNRFYHPDSIPIQRPAFGRIWGSYPNSKSIRRPSIRRIWGSLQQLAESGEGELWKQDHEVNEGKHKKKDQEGTNSRSTGPPPGFEDKRYRVENIWDMEEGEIARAKYTVHVSNVAIQMKNEDFRKCCEVYGKVERISYLRSYKFPESMVCFIRYNQENQAEIAQKRLGGTRRFGKVWRANWARRDLQPLDSQGNTDPKKKDRAAVDVEGSNRIIGEQNEEITDFMNRSWMLVMERKKPIEEIREIVESHGVLEVSLIQWGLYGVMGEWVTKLEDLKKHFVRVEKIDPKEKRHKRYCWIEVKGIPMQAWSIGSMINVARQWGNLLALDIETDMAYRVDVARLFIETEDIEKINIAKELSFQNEVFKILVQEVEREEELDARVCQQSTLGKHSGQLDPSPVASEGDAKELLGEKGDDNNVFGESGEKEEFQLGKDMEGFNQNKDHEEKEDDQEDSSESEGEGFGDTHVVETPPAQVTFVNRTPIFIPGSTESKRGGDNDLLKDFIKSFKSGKNKDKGDCTCCTSFYKKRNQAEEVESGVRELAKGEIQEFEDPSKVGCKRKVGNSKQRTPKRKSQCIPRKGFFMKEAKITKNKGRRKKKNQRKDKDSLGLRDSTSESMEAISEGLDLCEELGVKIKCNSAKRLQFEKFMMD